MNRPTRIAFAAASASLLACGSDPAAEVARVEPTTNDTNNLPAETPTTAAEETTTSTEPAPTTTEPPVTVTSAPPHRPITTLAVVPTTEPPVLPERAQDDLTDVEWAIHAAFGAEGPRAVRVAQCESTLNPGAQNGDHAGLFQLARRWHEARAARLGYSWDQMYTVFGNVAVAYDLWAEQGWRPWTCKP